MNTVIALIGNPSVLQCNLIGMSFTIKISDDHKDSLADTLRKTLEVSVVIGHTHLLRFKRHFRFRITKNITGNAKSFEDIKEFVRFLEKHVEFDDFSHLTDESVLNDDDIHLEVMI